MEVAVRAGIQHFQACRVYPDLWVGVRKVWKREKEGLMKPGCEVPYDDR